MHSVQIPRPAVRMSARDAGFLYLERPNAPLHIGCVGVFDGRITCTDLAGLIESRLPRLRRYTQRALSVPLWVDHPSWQDDPAFDVRNHLHRWALPAPGGEGELGDLCAKLLALPLDRSRPLWEMHVLEGLDGDRTAVLQKVHHCMIDGMAGAQLLEVLLDERPAPPAPPRLPGPVPALPGSGARLGRALAERLRRRAQASASLVGALARPGAVRDAAVQLGEAALTALRLASNDVPELPWNAPVGPRRRLAFTRLPMQQVREIRDTLGGTVNDVVLCVLAGGLHRQLEGRGRSTRGLKVVAAVPVSLRSPAEARNLGNRISAMLVPLAVKASSEVARLAATKRIMAALKAEAAWKGPDALLSMIDAMTPGLVALLAQQLQIGRFANLIVTNVPGPPAQRFLGPARAQALYPIVPIMGSIGLGAAVFSYDGWLHVGLNADPQLVPDLEKLKQGIEEAFTALLAGG